MGIFRSHLHIMCMEQAKEGAVVKGKVLVLGQQSVFATLEDVKEVLSSRGVPPRELPSGFDTANKIPSWKRTWYDRFTNVQSVFMTLGAEAVTVADASSYENPDVLIDLNLPVGEEYDGKFDTIFDDGVLEHVFNVPVALDNICRMLKPGGSIILVHPSSNAIDHGFYSFSPTLYFDYFGVNGFTKMACYLTEGSPYVYGKKAKVYRYSHVGQEFPIVSGQEIIVAFVATRERAYDPALVKRPNQTLYSEELWIAPQDVSGRQLTFREKVKELARQVRYRTMNAWPFFVEKFLYTKIYTRGRGANLEYLGKF